MVGFCEPGLLNLYIENAIDQIAGTRTQLDRYRKSNILLIAFEQVILLAQQPI